MSLHLSGVACLQVSSFLSDQSLVSDQVLVKMELMEDKINVCEQLVQDGLHGIVMENQNTHCIIY